MADTGTTPPSAPLVLVDDDGDDDVSMSKAPASSPTELPNSGAGAGAGAGVGAAAGSNGATHGDTAGASSPAARPVKRPRTSPGSNDGSPPQRGRVRLRGRPRARGGTTARGTRALAARAMQPPSVLPTVPTPTLIDDEDDTVAAPPPQKKARGRTRKPSRKSKAAEDAKGGLEEDAKPKAKAKPRKRATKKGAAAKKRAPRAKATRGRRKSSGASTGRGSIVDDDDEDDNDSDFGGAVTDAALARAVAGSKSRAARSRKKVKRVGPDEHDLDDLLGPEADTTAPKLYCLCQRPAGDSFMIECARGNGGCGGWVHPVCCGLRVGVANATTLGEYTCPWCAGFVKGRRRRLVPLPVPPPVSVRALPQPLLCAVAPCAAAPCAAASKHALTRRRWLLHLLPCTCTCARRSPRSSSSTRSSRGGRSRKGSASTGTGIPITRATCCRRRPWRRRRTRRP